MPVLDQIFLTAALTISGSVIVFVIGKLIEVTIIHPIQKFNEEKQNALDRVDYHCNTLTNYFSENPNEHELLMIKEIKRDLRASATKLNSKYAMIPCKRFFSWLRLIPTAERVGIAYSGLIYLHNSILYENSRERILNRIEMNDRQIDRVKCSLTNQPIPATLKPKTNN